MRRSAVVAVAVMALILTACTPQPDSTPPPTQTSPAEPEPVAEAITVAAGEKPPTAFDGDCTAAYSAGELSALIGVELEFTSSSSPGTLGNVGGLRCSWENGGLAVRMDVVPLADLDGAVFTPDEEQYYFVDCMADWVCAARAASDRAEVFLSFQQFEGATRDQVDGWGEAIGGAVLEKYAAADPISWRRDRAGWWPQLDCDVVTEALAAQLGTPLESQGAGYHDPPAPAVVLADRASRWSSCYATTDLGSIELYTSAGTAWAVPPEGVTEEVDAGVAGVRVYRDPGYESAESDSFLLTDGVNSATAYVHVDPAWGPDGALRAIAAVAAAGWV